MKKLLFVLALSVFSSGILASTIKTSSEVVGEIRVEVYKGNSHSYFVSRDGNWSSSQCPDAKYVYVSEKMAGAKAMFELALSSKLNNIPIKFHGLCGDKKGQKQYIRGRYAIY